MSGGAAPSIPDWQPARGMPYEDVENMRPETQEMVAM